jgi:ATP-binding cassette subfamily F protein 3
MVRAINLTFAYSDKPVFDKANFIIGENQKIGLVGTNGSGKSTLLKIIMGQEAQTEGKMEIVGKVGYVPQEVIRDAILDKSETILEYVKGNETIEEFELKKIFANLGIEKLDLDKSPKKLSGGQKTRLALARALIQKPDILLLDEPTNFMDMEGKKWVMNFLSRYPKTLILISHDLELMDHSIDKILYINNYTNKIDEYKGNYTDFIRLKKEKEENLRKEIKVKSRHLKKAEARYENMRANSKKSILRRRIEREKEALPELPPEVRKVRIKLPDPVQVGELVLKVIDISKFYGDKKIFENLDFTILRNEKIAIIGQNGVGKSTLIKILMGLQKPDNGEIRKDYNLKIGYYSQEFETFDLNKTLIEIMMDKTKQGEGFSRAFLGRFNFLGDKAFQKIETLSGGEKTRLSIALITADNYNLLILDEPTTYLDVLSQRIILDTIKEYKGTMIIVSHTEDFIKELNPTKAFLMPENKMVYWDEKYLKRVSET